MENSIYIDWFEHCFHRNTPLPPKYFYFWKLGSSNQTINLFGGIGVFGESCVQFILP